MNAHLMWIQKFHHFVYEVFVILVLYSAATSYAVPIMLNASARFGVKSNSITWSFK